MAAMTNQITSLINQLRKLVTLSGSEGNPLQGTENVPYATGFRILKFNYTDGEAQHTETSFILGWNAPAQLETQPGVSYNIYALRHGLDRVPTKVAEASTSPVRVAFRPTRYDAVLTPVTFFIQTQLGNGARNAVETCPTTSDFVFQNIYNIRFGTGVVGSTPLNGSNPGITLPANPHTYINVKVGPNGTNYYVPAYQF